MRKVGNVLCDKCSRRIIALTAQGCVCGCDSCAPSRATWLKSQNQQQPITIGPEVSNVLFFLKPIGYRIAVTRISLEKGIHDVSEIEAVEMHESSTFHSMRRADNILDCVNKPNVFTYLGTVCSICPHRHISDHRLQWK